MSGAASSSELASALPESTTAVRSDPAAELAVIAGALGRMAQAARDDRAALERLRHMLGEMTEVIAQAKALPAEMNVLLDEFEHRVDAMMEAAGGMPAGAPPAEASAPPAEAVAPAIETIAPAAEAPVPAGEADQVPTVSGVVSDLRPDEPAPESAVPQAEQTATDKGPTVAMLTAMVQALRESIVELPPEPEPIAEAASPATPTVETIDIESLIALDALPETVAHVAEGAPAPVTEPLSDFVAAFSEQPEAESPIESLLAAEPAMETPAAAPPPVFDIHETALLESLEQMEARPIPPPDEGTAVIFTRQPEVDESPLVEQELGPEPQSETAALSDAGPATAEPETIAAQQFEPALAQQEPVPPGADNSRWNARRSPAERRRRRAAGYGCHGHAHGGR